MLTRIEIDGFKSFRDFKLDIPPFLVIIGRNNAGKSNIFDAIQFLSRLAGQPVLEAAQQTRGDIAHLFHRFTDGTPVRVMSFAVEVLLDGSVTDAFGDSVRVSHSRIRYELVIELRETGHTRALRPFVVRESARKISQADDRWIRDLDHAARPQVKYSGGVADLLQTDEDEQGFPRFSILEQDNPSRARHLRAISATASVLSTLTTATDLPLLYALKRELQSWRLLYLDPSALRRPDSYDDPDMLATNGAHLANTLRRLVDETGDADRPDGVLNDLSADVATIIPGIVRVALNEDDARRQRQVEVITQDEAPYSALVASDGTLRTIALLTALYDPAGAGLICFEEPENGMFPGRLFQFVESLRLLVDRGRKEGALTQLIVSSHSPAILKALKPPSGRVRQDAIYLDVATRAGKGQARSRISKYRYLIGSAASAEDDLPPGVVVSPSEIAEFEVSAALER
ncbi:AAA family ATPase [Actinoplanes sp. TFC3]|uniref:AAA family ATPase n=1 Tax=Actinoplanes sp. TFC3 TaxID=1710355 RepID=UPI00083334B2|nr:AAA family ATPase [Actinoplanes sp. TFC3]